MELAHPSRPLRPRPAGDTPDRRRPRAREAGWSCGGVLLGDRLRCKAMRTHGMPAGPDDASQTWRNEGCRCRLRDAALSRVGRSDPGRLARRTVGVTGLRRRRRGPDRHQPLGDVGVGRRRPVDPIQAGPIVHYDPGSSFSRAILDGGETIRVAIGEAMDRRVHDAFGVIAGVLEPLGYYVLTLG